MKKVLFRALLVCAVFGCSGPDKVIDQIAVGIERGAVLRTLEINQGELYVNEPTTTFDITLEEMDIEDGALLSSVNVYLSFIDNTIAGNSVSVPSSLFKTYVAADFTNGANNLPVISLRYSYNELLEAVGLSIEETNCKDQFRIDLELILTDGRKFQNENSGNSVVNTTSFFKSPFSYIINIVAPTSENAFLGMYQLEHIEDGFFGPTFLIDQQVLVEKGHSTNVRTFRIEQPFSRIRGDIILEFSITCDAIIITRYILALNACRDFGEVGLPIVTFPPEGTVLGPDNERALISDVDDSVFEIWYVEAFEGRDEGCGFRDFPAKIRLTKQ